MIIITFGEPEEEAVQKICQLFDNNELGKILCIDNRKDGFHTLKIDCKERNIYYKDEKIPLNHLEFFTLAYLVAYPNWIFTKEQIYEAVWKEPGESCGSAVSNVISQIRRKLRQAGVEQEYIQTVINQGYKFVAERRGCRLIPIFKSPI